MNEIPHEGWLLLLVNAVPDPLQNPSTDEEGPERNQREFTSDEPESESEQKHQYRENSGERDVVHRRYDDQDDCRIEGRADLRKQSEKRENNHRDADSVTDLVSARCVKRGVVVEVRLDGSHTRRIRRSSGESRRGTSC